MHSSVSSWSFISNTSKISMIFRLILASIFEYYDIGAELLVWADEYAFEGAVRNELWLGSEKLFKCRRRKNSISYRVYCKLLWCYKIVVGAWRIMPNFRFKARNNIPGGSNFELKCHFKTFCGKSVWWDVIQLCKIKESYLE